MLDLIMVLAGEDPNLDFRCSIRITPCSVMSSVVLVCLEMALYNSYSIQVLELSLFQVATEHIFNSSSNYGIRKYCFW